MRKGRGVGGMRGGRKEAYVILVDSISQTDILNPLRRLAQTQSTILPHTGSSTTEAHPSNLPTPPHLAVPQNPPIHRLQPKHEGTSMKQLQIRAQSVSRAMRSHYLALPHDIISEYTTQLATLPCNQSPACMHFDHGPVTL